MSFTRYRGGRLPPHPDDTHPRLWVDDFLSPMRASIPDTISWAGGITDWGMDLNDQLGDCGIAGADHWQMAWSQAASGSHASWGDALVQETYSAVGGYKPGDPSTDNGISLQDMLSYWRKTGIVLPGGKTDKILAYGALRPGSWLRPERVTAMWNFGPLYTGLNLPQSAEDAFPQPWTVVPGSPIAGGHCVLQVEELRATDEIGYVSWGQVVRASRAFLMQYAEEIWVAITQDFIERSGANPDGVDLQGMNEALGQLTGSSNPLGLKTATYMGGTMSETSEQGVSGPSNWLGGVPGPGEPQATDANPEQEQAPAEEPQAAEAETAAAEPEPSSAYAQAGPPEAVPVITATSNESPKLAPNAVSASAKAHHGLEAIKELAASGEQEALGEIKSIAARIQAELEKYLPAGMLQAAEAEGKALAQGK